MTHIGIGGAFEKALHSLIRYILVGYFIWVMDIFKPSKYRDRKRR